MENKRQCIELADIFSSRADMFLKEGQLKQEQKKAYKSIIECRTAALGGHIDKCNKCGYLRPSYNSCRNRHCPKCQFIKKAQWVDRLAGNLPPVKCFHIVFTIPDCLHKIFYTNQKQAYGLLFRSAGQALLQCASSHQYLGAQTGAAAILHTWGQTLAYHPHLHMIVPAGGLSEDQMEWVPSGKKFFLPVKILSAVFRGILCKNLEHAIKSGAINLPEGTIGFGEVKKQCYAKKWVVYCEKPFACPDNLIGYLGNYTHRVAISNHRIIAHQDNKVTFYYKDYKSGGIKRLISLDDNEFIRRFMQHVLPGGFYKIRYFGILAMCNMKTKLHTCFDLIPQASYLPVLQGLSALEVMRCITGIDPLMCPKCKSGRMVPQTVLSVNNPGHG